MPLKLRNIVLSTHINEIPGIAYQWVKFLKNRTDNLVIVTHPLHEWLINHPLYAVNAGVTLFVDGEYSFERRFPKVQMPYAVARIRDVAFSLYYTLKLARTLKCQFDLFIGIDCLNAFTGIILRKLGIVKRVIFYPVEYATNRFDDGLRNMAYQKLVQFVTHNSDLVWNVSSRIARYSRQFTISDKRNMIVPHGYNPPPEKPLTDFNLDPTHKKLVYVGGLGPEAGLPLVIESLPEIVKRIPEVRFYVIGHGQKEDIEALQRLVKKHKLEQCVHYLGIMPNQKVLEFLKQCDVGVSTASPVPSWTRFADMGMKVKEYLACSLPVITTRVVGQGAVIEKNHAGVTIDYKIEEMVEAAVRLLNDREFYEKCKSNTRPLVAEYTWKNITQQAWEKTLNFFNIKSRAD